MGTLDDSATSGQAIQPKYTWEAPTLTHVGRVDEVVLAGGGKLSAIAGDPGEPFRKPKGLE